MLRGSRWRVLDEMLGPTGRLNVSERSTRTPSGAPTPEDCEGRRTGKWIAKVDGVGFSDESASRLEVHDLLGRLSGGTVSIQSSNVVSTNAPRPHAAHNRISP